MSIFDAISGKLSDAAKEEFKKAAEGMKLADLSTGEYVAKGKYEAELRDANAKLKEAQERIVAMGEEVKKAQAAGASLEELKTKLAQSEAEWQRKLAEAETKAAQERRTAALKDKLNAAGCKDADYALFKLNQKGVLDKLEFKDNGDIVGLTDYIKELQTENPAHWTAENQRETYIPGKQAQTGGKNPWLKDSFNLTLQGQIYRDDPDKARLLAAEAGIIIQ